MGGGEGGEGEYIYMCVGGPSFVKSHGQKGGNTLHTAILDSYYCTTRPTMLYRCHTSATATPPYTHLFEERLPLVQRVHLSLVQRRVVRHRILGVQRRHPCPPHSQRAKHQHSSRTHSPSPLLPSLPANTLYPLPGAYISPREETSNTLPLIAT